MAHGRPWYKRAGGDLLMATLSMPDSDHKWAYSAIIDVLNDRDRPLADEAGFICGFTGLSKRRWGVVRAYLIDHGFLALDDQGRITNPRFERERAERDEAHQRSVEAGRTGGRKSAAMRQPELALGEQDNSNLSPKKQAEESEINGSKVKDKSPVPEREASNLNGLSQPPPQPSRARKRLEARVESLDSTTTSLIENSALDPLEVSNHLTRIAGVRNIDPARIVANQNITREWLNLGVPIPDLEQAIIDARDHASRPIFSLRYFDPNIRQAQARKDYPNERGCSDPSRIADPLLREYVQRGGTLG